MLWWRRREREEDLERELRSDLELETAEQQERGLSPEEARCAAQRAFGNTTRIKEATREAWGRIALEQIVQDLGYAIRVLRKNAGFTFVAVLSLALGIGANTAIFTFVNAALLKPLPYPAPERIVALSERPPKGGGTALVHPRSFLEWHDRSRSFEALALAQNIPLNTDGSDGPEQISGLWATPELFAAFGVAPLLGRTFTEAETGPGLNPVVILGHGYWRRRFASDPNIVGKTIRLQQQIGTIQGVMPPGFRVGTADQDIYLPLPINRNRPEAVGSRAFQCYGRLGPGATLESARAEMSVIVDQAGRDFAIDKGWGISLVPLREQLVRESRQALLLLQGVVVLVLLIACANLAGLLLTRGVGRREELALRASLGASRTRLLQQLLIESMVLSISGGMVGLILGASTSQMLVALAKNAVAFGQMANVGLDGRVLLFAVALSILTGIVFGLIPAWRLSRFDLQSNLKERTGGSGDRRQQWFRAALVVGEIALAVVMLVGTGLFLRTFSAMLAVRLGFQPEHVLTMKMFVTGDPVRRANLIESVRVGVEALPDVRAAGTIQFLPLGNFTNRGPFHFPGRAKEDVAANREADTSIVSRGYFSAMGIPILRGRSFSEQDRMGARRVALVNQTFVEKYCRNEDPLGLLAVGDWSTSEPAEIVGVVGDIRHDALTTEPQPTFFLSQAQTPGYITYLVVRTQAEPNKLASAIRHEVQKVDPAQPVTDVRMMQEYVTRALARPRLYAVSVGIFSTLALILAAIGLYGLMAYSVNQRTHEIGIRMALGAAPRTVLCSIIGHGGRLACLGLAIGIATAAAMSRFVASFLYGVNTYDALTYCGVAGVLGSVALVAAFIPARRASRIDPMVALRDQ